MRKISLLALAVAGLAAGCVAEDQGTAFIEGVFPLDPANDCSVDADDETFVATALLDIGFDAATANSLVLPLKVRTNLPASVTTQDITQDEQRSPNFQNYGYVDNNIITIEESEVFFTTDADRADQTALQNDGTPINENTARRSGASGTLFNENTQLLSPSVVFVTAITAQDAAQLQGEQFIADALNAANPNGASANRARITVNIRLNGKTTGEADVRTPAFPFPVDLCRGCLVPQCPAGQVAVPGVAGACVRGQDFPFVCQ